MPLDSPSLWEAHYASNSSIYICSSTLDAEYLFPTSLHYLRISPLLGEASFEKGSITRVVSDTPRFSCFLSVTAELGLPKIR